ncbi:MAG: serine hydrolase, partial [Phyllobacteriaceae bacterium]|nr:serine hydrolase [Phyllobacteriaceae bacterium]
ILDQVGAWKVKAYTEGLLKELPMTTINAAEKLYKDKRQAAREAVRRERPQAHRSPVRPGGGQLPAPAAGRVRARLAARRVEVAEADVPFAEPGRHAYSNTNYVLAGILLEEVTGMSYADLLSERIITPLGSMGAHITGRAGDTLPPIVIRGGGLHGAGR